MTPLPDCFGLLRLGELGRAEELDHVIEGSRHVIGQHVAGAGMSGINPSELRSAQPGLGPLVIVKDVAEGSVEVACHYRDKVCRVQEVDLVTARIVLGVAADVSPLALGKIGEHALFPPAVGEGGDQLVLLGTGALRRCRA